MIKQFILVSFLMLALIYFPAKGQNVGDSAPNFTVDIAGGGTFSLSDHYGKVVMIFFFGADCGLCKESGPAVEGIYTDYQSETDFVAIGLDTWPNSTDAKVNGFAGFTGITFPMGIDANSVKTAYAHTYDRLVVIDRDGIIRSKNNARAINDINSVKSVIQTYLDVVAVVNNVTEDKRSISLYPMPARDFVNAELYLENSSDVQFVLSDITGKTRMNTSIYLEAGAQQLEFDVNDLEQGIYLYRVSFDNRVESGKLLIQ